MKTTLLTLLTAFIFITYINTFEVWVLWMLVYTILILVLYRDLDKDCQHNHIRGLKDRIDQLKVDNDSLEMICDRQYEELKNTYTKEIKNETK